MAPNEHSHEVTGRRRFLTSSGIALLGLSGLAGAASAQQGQNGPPTNIDDQRDTQRFIAWTAKADSERQVEAGYEQLSDAELDRVEAAYRAPVRTDYSIEDFAQPMGDRPDEINPLSEVSGGRGSNSESVGPQQIGCNSDSESHARTIAGQEVHETTHSLGFCYDGDSISQENNDSSGSTSVPLWNHLGLLDSFIQVQGDEVYSTRIHEYEHDPPGVYINEATVIDLKGHADGTIETLNEAIVDL